MLSYGDELRDRVTRLLADVGPLNTVCGLGYAESDPELLATNFEALRDSDWRFVDLHDPKQLARHLNATVLVVAADLASVPAPLLRLVEAVVDRRPRVELDPPVTRATQSVVVVLNGASAPEQLTPALHRIPYWEFIP